MDAIVVVGPKVNEPLLRDVNGTYYVNGTTYVNCTTYINSLAYVNVTTNVNGTSHVNCISYLFGTSYVGIGEFHVDFLDWIFVLLINCWLN